MHLKRTCTLVLGSAALLLPATLFAQDTDMTAPNQPQQQSQTQQQQPGVRAMPHAAMQDSNATPGMTGQEMKDKMFLRKSAAGGIAEVKMGQLAADKGSADDVKAFGARMVTDHTQLSNEMKPIADSMGIRLPKEMDKADQAEYDKLASLSGEDFDKAYILDMLADHRKDWREFHEESMATNDPTLKTEVEKGEGVIRDHMRMAVKMAKDRNILPPRPTPPPTPPPAAQ